MLVIQIALGIVLGVILLAALPILLEFAGAIIADLFRPGPPPRPPAPPTHPTRPLSRPLKWFLLILLSFALVGLPFSYFGQSGSGKEDPEFGIAVALWFFLLCLGAVIAYALWHHDRNTQRAISRWKAVQTTAAADLEGHAG